MCYVGDEAPAFCTVAKWFKLFREGREHIEDDEPPGRSITETTSENIEQVRSIIDVDPHITIEELQAQTDLSHDTIQRIISDESEHEKNYCSLYTQAID